MGRLIPAGTGLDAYRLLELVIAPEAGGADVDGALAPAE